MMQQAKKGLSVSTFRILGFLSMLAWWSSHPSMAFDRPNVVLIVSDDHAWTDYGFMGHPTIQTPNIDQLASNSLVFRRGYVTSSLCCPSLASIITGRYPHQHKVTSNDPPIPPGMNDRDFYGSPLFAQGRETMTQQLAAANTLPDILKKFEYRSLQTGKWWQGHFSRGGFTDGMTQGGRHGDEGLSIGRKTMEPINSFLDSCKASQQPFLVWYAPLMPHDPHTPPDRLLQKYIKQTDSIHIARYWAMVEWFDETCGELFGYLDKEGLKDNTVIVYVADNGWITDPTTGRYAPKSKQSPYDGGLRSPIMVRWPAKLAPRMSDTPVSSLDLFPTLLNACGVPVPADLPGIDLASEPAVAARKTLTGECFTHNFVDIDNPASSLRWRWIVEDGWKLIAPAAPNETGKPELYQVSADPEEVTDRAAAEPARVTAMTAKLDAWWPGH